MRWRDVLSVTVILMILCFFLLFFIGRDKIINEKASMEARVELLEKQMRKKIRPIIQINRASVYNTDGEVVIETVKELKTGKNQ